MVHDVVDDVMVVERIEAKQRLHRARKGEPVAVTHQKQPTFSPGAMSEHPRDDAIRTSLAESDIGVGELYPAPLVKLEVWRRGI